MAAALVLYGVWMLTTYLLEGLPTTLLRPEAQGLRIVYTTVTNLIVGTLGSVLILRRLVLSGAVTALEAGFGSPRRSLIGVTLGAVLGAAFLVAQDPPAVPLLVIINVFAQVLPVSVAEVLVCWSIVGSIAGSSVGQRAGRALKAIVLTAVASVAFGVYHVGHSAPFNSPSMIAPKRPLMDKALYGAPPAAAALPWAHDAADELAARRLSVGLHDPTAHEFLLQIRIESHACLLCGMGYLVPHSYVATCNFRFLGGVKTLCPTEQ